MNETNQRIKCYFRFYRSKILNSNLLNSDKMNSKERWVSRQVVDFLNLLVLDL